MAITDKRGAKAIRDIPKANAQRAHIETLTARGFTPQEIRDQLGCDIHYIYTVAKWVKHADQADYTMPYPDSDTEYVAKCMAEGGFPTAVMNGGHVEHQNYAGLQWSHRPRVKVAA